MRSYGGLGRHRKCWWAWIVIGCLAFFHLPLAEAEEAHAMISLQYTWGDISFQPVVIQATDEIDVRKPELYFDQTGYVSPTIWPYLNPRLTDNHEVIAMDVSEKRILLCLSKDNQQFLRIAQWDAALHDYTILDTDVLPSLSELDTYHDGNAVLLLVPAMATAQQDDECLFLTFQQVDNSWYLTNFTDGQSFAATLSSDGYLFEDYDEPNPEHMWTAHDIMTFANFSVTDLFRCLQEYLGSTASF